MSVHRLTDVVPVEPIEVVIAVAHARARSALLALLLGEPDVRPVGAASDAAAAIRLLRHRSPAVAVVDLGVLGPAGLCRLPMLATAAPGSAFVVVGMHDHPGFAAWVCAAGAAGYVRLDEAAERLGPAVVSAASVTT